jgi:hypothetical protein
MAHIKNFKQFIESIEKDAYQPIIKRMQVLAGINPTDTDKKETYLIKITFETESLLLEHITLKSFKGSTNRMLKHPATTHPPVKGHYHVYPKNGKDEIYAVNFDGTAHHQKNKGFEIPKKEADELRALGVDINPDRIIEYLETYEDGNQLLLTESLSNDYVSIFIEINEDEA